MSNDIFPVFKIIEKSRCTGCECCVNVCPKQCITMEPNEEGFLYPTFDESMCVNCQLCSQRCPVINAVEKKDIKYECYTGFAKSKEIVNSSASGGMFSLLVDEFLKISEGNGYVSGVVWNDNFKKTVHIVTDDINQIYKMRSSKYIQSYKGSAFKKIKELLEYDKYVMFSGTPCECAGLKSYLNKDYNKLFIVDLVCQGPTTPLAMDQFIDHISKKNKYIIKSIDMRHVYKTPWIPQWIKIEFENRCSFVKLFYETAIGRAVHIMQRMSCYSCQFNGNRRASDITIGDHHGAKIDDPCYNPYGTSIIIINSKKGNELVSGLKKHAELLQVSYSSLLEKNPRINSAGKEPSKRREFSQSIINDGVIIAAKGSWSVRERIRIRLPYSIRMTVRKLRKKI
ncbi:Coenzyme F420 hydrogenase/dehydrogenase, beta subunit C-terminal domain [Ruminococcus sp.]|uniref:Coenzyme F420 hydrogenase/dehydrogenase, beta subunit C-terminal domain n=1 Tax=Ruminococcus sp. TaxID=41978 RepID=UPI0025DB6D05|nr:Coenzyme F420 hydrogenase/dehydrogenase, beta subunit C-terminal domain [Ruminococcus sp.]